MANELYIHTLRQLRDGCEAEHMDTETAALDAAIKALSCEGDYISRKAAINAAIDAINEWGGGWDAEREVRDAINALPSAQPNLQPTCNKLATDCISRQAAIDAADRADYTGLAVEDVKKVTDEVVKGLKQLPSAQPEIIRCKDCVKREHCRTTNVWAIAPSDDWYCADAERRTDG